MRVLYRICLIAHLFFAGRSVFAWGETRRSCIAYFQTSSRFVAPPARGEVVSAGRAHRYFETADLGATRSFFAAFEPGVASDQLNEPRDGGIGAFGGPIQDSVRSAVQLAQEANTLDRAPARPEGLEISGDTGAFFAADVAFFRRSISWLGAPHANAVDPQFWARLGSGAWTRSRSDIAFVIWMTRARQTLRFANAHRVYALVRRLSRLDTLATRAACFAATGEFERFTEAGLSFEQFMALGIAYVELALQFPHADPAQDDWRWLIPAFLIQGVVPMPLERASGFYSMLAVAASLSMAPISDDDVQAAIARARYLPFLFEIPEVQIWMRVRLRGQELVSLAAPISGASSRRPSGEEWAIMMLRSLNDAAILPHAGYGALASLLEDAHGDMLVAAGVTAHAFGESEESVIPLREWARRVRAAVAIRAEDPILWNQTRNLVRRPRFARL